MTVLDQFKLDGDVAVITGAGRGIGEGIAHVLADAGASVVLAARREEEIQKVADDINGFDAPLADVWERYRNVYFNEDTQAGESLTTEAIPGLPENSALYWRVRYRDRSLDWSPWTAPVPFFTSESLALLVNPSLAKACSSGRTWRPDRPPPARPP